ncbi:unnamed protein product [Brugia pahangi]|uniref:Ovule protein n=1 Tax=Brugia pahangi TaxID=6280 RepID=A0A0N4TL19_BRUPA|nr:unnamed protein product [Brugia pahangi]
MDLKFKTIYQLKSAFACTNQFISSFSRSQTCLEDDTRCTSNFSSEWNIKMMQAILMSILHKNT